MIPVNKVRSAESGNNCTDADIGNTKATVRTRCARSAQAKAALSNIAYYNGKNNVNVSQHRIFRIDLTLRVLR